MRSGREHVPEENLQHQIKALQRWEEENKKGSVGWTVAPVPRDVWDSLDRSRQADFWSALDTSSKEVMRFSMSPKLTTEELESLDIEAQKIAVLKQAGEYVAPERTPVRMRSFIRMGAVLLH